MMLLVENWKGVGALGYGNPGKGVPETMLTSLTFEWWKMLLFGRKEKGEKEKRNVLVLRCGASDFFHSVFGLPVSNCPT